MQRTDNSGDGVEGRTSAAGRSGSVRLRRLIGRRELRARDGEKASDAVLEWFWAEALCHIECSLHGVVAELDGVKVVRFGD